MSAIPDWQTPPALLTLQLVGGGGGIPVPTDPCHSWPGLPTPPLQQGTRTHLSPGLPRLRPPALLTNVLSIIFPSTCQSLLILSHPTKGRSPFHRNQLTGSLGVILPPVLWQPNERDIPNTPNGHSGHIFTPQKCLARWLEWSTISSAV